MVTGRGGNSVHLQTTQPLWVEVVHCVLVIFPYRYQAPGLCLSAHLDGTLQSLITKEELFLIVSVLMISGASFSDNSTSAHLGGDAIHAC